MKRNLNDTEIIATNFKKRLSGVSTTITQLLPAQIAQNVKIKLLGFGLPNKLPYISCIALKDLWKKPINRPFYILHTRRHIEMIFGVILRDLLKANIKLVFTAAAQRQQKKISYYLMRKMDRLISVNPKISTFLKIPHKVIMHGIDTEKFKPGLSNLNIESEHIIGCLGRIRFNKGTHLFIEAMIELLPQFKDWKAIFGGLITPKNKLYAHKIFDKIKKANLEHRILYIGEVDSSAIYKKLDLYVSPSLNEGFGLTPLEAMSSEVPVITGNTGIYSQVINENFGKIVEPLTIQNLTEAIKPYFENPNKLKIMGRNARKHIVENYSLKNEALALKELYEDLFNSK